MTRRGSKGAGGASTPSTPLQGALTKDDSVESLALQMILQRMEQYEKQQQMLMSTFQQTLTATADRMDQMWQEFDRRLKLEKAEAAEASKLVTEKLEALLTAKQPDPETQEALIKSQMAKVRDELQNSAARFKEYLNTCKTGTIKSDELEPVQLQINGVGIIVKPGVNRKVPAPYVEAWEKRVEMKRWATGYTRMFEANGNPLDANKLNQLRGLPPMWNNETGAIK